MQSLVIREIPDTEINAQFFRSILIQFQYSDSIFRQNMNFNFYDFRMIISLTYFYVFRIWFKSLLISTL